jgi:hypothetical protein
MSAQGNRPKYRPRQASSEEEEAIASILGRLSAATPRGRRLYGTARLEAVPEPEPEGDDEAEAA